MTKPSTFWLSSLAAAVGLSVAIAFLFPFGMLGIEPGPERERGWLLTVFTSGVMAICFGASALLGWIAPLTVRDVDDAGNVNAALDARREAMSRMRSSPFFYNFAGWTVSTGGFLLLIYFAGWIYTGR